MENKVQIRFQDADPAGILFFANAFQLAHDSWADYLRAQDIGFKDWFENSEFAFPIRHCESDFFSPLFAGEEYDCEVHQERLGETSLTAKFSYSKEGTTCCVVCMTVVCISKDTRKKAPWPGALKEKLRQDK